MSKKYSLTNQQFYPTQSKIRQIVQNELQCFFIDIKQQIQQKIKQIDHSIIEIKQQIITIQQNCLRKMKGSGVDSKILNRMQTLEQKIQEVKNLRNQELQKMIQEFRNASSNQSLQRKQDKSPLFRKSNAGPSLDLNNIIFGQQNVKSMTNSIVPPKKIIQQHKSTVIKPPLPKPKHASQNNLQFSQKVSTSSRSSQSEQNKKNIEKNIYPQISRGNQSDLYLNSQSNSQSKITHQNRKQETEQKQQSTYQNQNNLIINSNITENLNKNKNSFLRKKSFKKINVIHQEQVEESILSTQ